ncbi:tetratricopeptide repeat protein [Campylobacter sp. 19-13652]|uniref:tetratricopeptide repeat protein n=1 Tax=Campylobacter sp. 19-13652 TaxID=2840180 RepID=UPI001C8441F0|nr:tetratricopeptide repeat protein [Campylobacter sp. 19-13652]
MQRTIFATMVAFSLLSVGIFYNNADDYYKKANKLYTNGDKVKSIKFFTKSCNGNYALACTRLANIYEMGNIVTKDYEKAMQLYDKGCKQGDARGCWYLASMYESGRGAKVDIEKALNLYNKACKNNISIACDDIKELQKLNKNVKASVGR